MEVGSAAAIRAAMEGTRMGALVAVGALGKMWWMVLRNPASEHFMRTGGA